MTQTPKISLIAYESKYPGKVFVAVPNERGRYVLTDRCVIEVDCPHCKAASGEPCHSRHGHYWTGTHVDRRYQWQREKRKRAYEKPKAFEKEEKPRIRVQSGATLIYI